MAQYQSIPAATHHANAEQPEEETVTIHQSNGMVWRITGALLLLFVGLAGFATTTQTSRSDTSLLAGTSAATALLRSTTTTTIGTDGYDSSVVESCCEYGTDCSPWINCIYCCNSYSVWVCCN